MCCQIRTIDTIQVISLVVGDAIQKCLSITHIIVTFLHQVYNSIFPWCIVIDTIQMYLYILHIILTLLGKLIHGTDVAKPHFLIGRVHNYI
jgi:hypothetical protein